MSSKRHLRRSQCERKVKYKSAKEARAKNLMMVKMGYESLTAYPCAFGSHWHLGHEPQRVEEAKAVNKRTFKIRQQIEVV
jgi:hypothetical protein